MNSYLCVFVELRVCLCINNFQNELLRVGVKSESQFQSFIARPAPDYNADGAYVPNLSGRCATTRRPNDPRRPQRAPQRPRRAPADEERPAANRRRAQGRNQADANTAAVFRPKVTTKVYVCLHVFLAAFACLWPLFVIDPPSSQTLFSQEVDIAEFPPLVESTKVAGVGYSGKRKRIETCVYMRVLCFIESIFVCSFSSVQP